MKYKLGCISRKNKSHIYVVFVRNSQEGWLIGLASHIRTAKNLMPLFKGATLNMMDFDNYFLEIWKMIFENGMKSGFLKTVIKKQLKTVIY